VYKFFGPLCILTMQNIKKQCAQFRPTGNNYNRLSFTHSTASKIAQLEYETSSQLCTESYRLN